MENLDSLFIQLAYEEAQKSLKEGGIPNGSILVIDGQVIAKGYNKCIQEKSMIKHGETDCLENSKRQISPQDIQRATLYTTLSPCYMCAGMVLLNKIPRVVIGENITFEQSEGLLRDKGVELQVLNDQKCVDMMLQFIISNPKPWGECIGLSAQQVLDKYKNIFREVSQQLQKGLAET